MPVTLSKINTLNSDAQAACERILKSFEAQPDLMMAWQQCIDQPDQHAIWLGWFNDRVVSFAVLSGAEIKAFAVHKATQHRGVGKRTAQLLNEQVDGLKWPDKLQTFA